MISNFRIYLLVPILFFFYSCSFKISNLIINTDNEHIKINAEIFDKGGIGGQPTFNDSNFEKFLKLCKKNRVRCEKTSSSREAFINGHTETEIVLVLECNGFDKANALMSDFKSNWSNCDLELNFITNEDNNVVNIALKPFRFNKNAYIEIENTSNITYSPNQSQFNLELQREGFRDVTYKVIEDTVNDDKLQEIRYEYKTSKSFIGWDRNDWTFYCTLLGGVAILVGVIKFLYSFKIVRKENKSN